MQLEETRLPESKELSPLERSARMMAGIPVPELTQITVTKKKPKPTDEEVK
jgi:hypothetical protein